VHVLEEATTAAASRRSTEAAMNHGCTAGIRGSAPRRRRWTVSRSKVAGLLACIASLSTAGPAIADPSKPSPLRTVLAECEGLGTLEIVASHGDALWIGSQLHQLTSITIGGETQTFGKKAGFDAAPIECVSVTSGVAITLVAVPRSRSLVPDRAP
jgi:hypothetical protein